MAQCKRILMSLIFFASVFIPLHRTNASLQPELTVGIMSERHIVTVTGRNTVLYVHRTLEDDPFLIVPMGEKLVVEEKSGAFWVNGTEQKSDRLIVQPSGSGFVEVDGSPYRGYITLFKKAGMTVVNNVLIEDYLYGVVPKEMPASWRSEALRAQSVAARTFALKNRGRHRADGYDLCNTPECQVYEGMNAEAKASTDAVDATHGEVLFYQGEIADALFHTDSGGMTESSEIVWGSYVPYLRAVPEARAQTLPWNRSITSALFVQKIESTGRKIGNLKEIKLSRLQIGNGKGDRSHAGRVLTMRIIGDKGNVVLGGNKIRSLFALPSTLFNVRMQKSTVEFNGYGSGHGLGMSQWGAEAFAERGKNYKEILRYYYTGVSVEKLY